LNNVDKYVKPVAEITSGLNKNPKYEVVYTGTKDALYKVIMEKETNTTDHPPQEGKEEGTQ